MPEPTASQLAMLTALTDRQSTGRGAITAGLVATLSTLWKRFLVTRGASTRTTGMSAAVAREVTRAMTRAPSETEAAVLYEEAAVRSLAAQMADASRTAQSQAFNLSAQFQRDSLRVLGRQTAPLRATPGEVGRFDVDPIEVYLRPAGRYRYGRSQDEDVEQALQDASERLASLAETDVMLASRSGAFAVLQDPASDVKQWRRVLHPELARFGSCGLCIVASDRTYSVAELQPLHEHCHCEPMAIVGGVDPGASINEKDLQRLYEAAGDLGKQSTLGQDLKRLRVTIQEHGELGPVLRRQGQKFLDPEDVQQRRRDLAVAQRRTERSARSAARQSTVSSLSSDPRWVRGQLAQFEQRLRSLEARAADGADLQGPISYHRAQVERFRALLTA